MHSAAIWTKISTTFDKEIQRKPRLDPLIGLSRVFWPANQDNMCPICGQYKDSPILALKKTKICIVLREKKIDEVRW